MNKAYYKFPYIFFGFTAGILFLISCGSDSSINNSVASPLPVISDQMICTGLSNFTFTNTISQPTLNNLTCMKQSTGVIEKLALPAVFSDGWIVIGLGSNTGNGTTIFYK